MSVLTIGPGSVDLRPLPPPTRGVQIYAPIALATIGVGALAVVALWWQDTPAVVGLGGWLTNAGRIMGLLCGYAVIVLLALMSRAPALERGVGSDRLARWHAMGGRYTVSLALAHTVLIIWGYAVTAHSGPVSQTATLITAYPDVLMATVALGLLLLVGAVSARAARRRLRYEIWHLVHLYTYLAVALAFSHQFATGADFTDPHIRWAWSLMYVAVAATLLWYRVIVPVLNCFRHVLRVHAVVAESPDVVSVYVGGRNLARLRAESGQFLRWRFLTPDLWHAANPYSLSAAPRPDSLRITVRTAGSESGALADVRPGTRILAEGPYGAFTRHRRRRRQRKVLLIGIGIGISPVRALFEDLEAGPGGLTLLYRARRADDLVLEPELQAIAAARGARYQPVLGPRGSTPDTDPLSRHRLLELVPDLAEHEVFLCGPDDLGDQLVRTLRSAGVPAACIHRESFRL